MTAPLPAAPAPAAPTMTGCFDCGRPCQGAYCSGPCRNREDQHDTDDYEEDCDV